MPNEELEKEDFGLDENNLPEPYHLTRSQKTMAVFLAFFALVVIIIWSIQFRNNIYKPFNSDDTNGNLASSETTDSSKVDMSNLPSNASDLTAEQTQILKTWDTDNDGLSDFDEVYIYNTSPYLEDSDGDNLADGVEIKNGSNPNCPEGRICNQPTTASTTSSTDSNNNQDTNSSSLNTLNQTGTTDQTAASQTLTASDTAVLKSTIGQNMDAATLRQLLVQQGMDKTALDKISDADLMKSFQETLNK